MRNIITKLKQGFIKENQSYINITLFLIIATGFVIRFAGIFSGLRQSLPFYANIDETTVTRIAFFMIKNGDFNPHNFLYPAFPIYIQVLWQVLAYLFFVGAGKGVPEFENTGYPFPIFYLTGRFLISIMGTALIYLTYRLAKDLFNRKVGLLAAALLAITFAQVWVSQYITSDTPMMFFGLLSLIFSTKILKGDQSWKNYLWSGIFLGLAVASRYNGYVFAVPLIFAYVSSSSFRLKYFPYFSLKHVREIIISIMAMIGAFLAAAPYTIINLPKFLADYGGQVTAYKTGIYLNVSNGDGMANWIWYIRYAATSGLYYPLFILSVFGFIIGLILLNKNKMFIFSYLIAHIFLILNIGPNINKEKL